MEREEAEQIVREGVPEICEDCPTIGWRVKLFLEGHSIDEPTEIEAAKQELVDDLNENCLYGTRTRFLGCLSACQYGVIRESEPSDT